MRAIGRRLALLRQDESGVIAVVTALLAIVLLICAAFAVDIGRWYVEGQRLQRTVDAASLAGSPYLPGDLTKAREEARKVIALNGYDAAAVPNSAITIGDRPSRLKVTMSSQIPNAFATVMGLHHESVTRTATADFAAATSMGSPCNVIGNEPVGASETRVGDAAACPTAPNFWENIAGPDAPKQNGDRYATRTCAGPESNCLGGTNLDYSGGPGILGQSYYVYKITPRQTMASMTVQVFDPMFVDVGDYCEKNLGTATNGLWSGSNTANTHVSDAKLRYAWGFAKGTGGASTGQVNPTTAASNWSPQFCTGDNLFGGAAGDLNTSFLVLNPTDTLDPMQATPVAGCNTRSFGGFSGNLTNALTSSNVAAYRDDVARNFRQWVNLCTITSPQVNRDYYVLVRTNVPAGASAARMLDPQPDPAAKGNGHNRFSLRVNAGSSNGAVAVSALERMPIYAVLQGGTTTFHLARVSSANAGSTLRLTFFDTGESTQVASIGITNPSGSAPAGCRATGEVRTTPTGDFNQTTCTLSNVHSSQYNGKIQRIEIPVPSTYTCHDEIATDCWYRLHFTYPSGATVNDTTTWSASLDGDPVRLVQ